MSVAPAPPWATIFFVLYKDHFLPAWATNILFYKCFIDDVIANWFWNNNPLYNAHRWFWFQQDMQKWCGLEWEFSKCSNTCNLMDLSISIIIGCLNTTLFEKTQNLYLNIPHPPCTPMVCSMD